MTNFIYNNENKEKPKSIKEPKAEYLDLYNDFIAECLKNNPEDFIHDKKYDQKLLNESSINIGFCDKEVYRKLREEYNYDIDLIKKSGLVKDTYTMVYNDMIIFAYNSHYFKARGLEPDKEGKTVHMYPKEDILGSKPSYFIKGESNTLILSEGETDSIALKHLFPKDNIMGVGGVQTSLNYVKSIPNTTDKVCICYDNDKTGQTWQEKLGDELHSKGFKVELMSFPEEYKDIDELFRDKGIEGKKLIEYKNPVKLDKIRSSMDVMTFKELMDSDIQPVSYVIENLLSEEGITILGGDSGVGKSWIALYLSLKLSGGYDVFDRFPSQKCKVLYIDEENGKRAMYKRIQMLNPSFLMNFEPPNYENLILSNLNNVKLDTGNRHKETDGIDRFKDLIMQHQPKVCVIDSFVRFFMGEENSSSDVSKVYDTLKWAIKEYKTSFILLHHTVKQNGNKYVKTSLRGSGDLSALCDNVVMCTKNPGSKYIKVEQLKNRHDRELDKPFNLIMDNDNDNFSISYFGEEEGVSEDKSVEQLKALCDIISSDNLIEFDSGNTSFIRKQFVSKGYDKNHFYNIITILKREKVIKSVKKGKYEIMDCFKEYYEGLQ